MAGNRAERVMQGPMDTDLSLFMNMVDDARQKILENGCKKSKFDEKSKVWAFTRVRPLMTNEAQRKCFDVVTTLASVRAAFILQDLTNRLLILQICLYSSENVGWESCDARAEKKSRLGKVRRESHV